ncbi:uncharacterized protein VTP21DRAFT_11498 [Calcarisporiella thermophila]|uniref:uncharacterized protein n=1 Tax=Calcarisporiella thermophila TaxID=911321 RepID=UPI0037444DFC
MNVRQEQPLPTLSQLLFKHAQPPFCIYTFLRFLERCHPEHVNDLLFWLHAREHHLLCHTKKRKKKPLLDARASAERIYSVYFSSGAVKKLALPSHIEAEIKVTLETNILGREDLFQQAQQWIEQTRLAGVYPEFLRWCTRCNLAGQEGLRIIIGLLALFFGFSMEFSCILLDAKPWENRLWGFIPLTVGIYSLVTGILQLCPLLVLVANSYETTFFTLSKIQDSNIRRRLVQRSIVTLSACLLAIAVLFTIFSLIPGKRI